MNAIQLRPYQIKAIDAIQNALEREQKHIVIEMASGCGKGHVFEKTVEILSRRNSEKILVVTRSMLIKEQIEQRFFEKNKDFIQFDKDNIVVENEQKIFRNSNEKIGEYQFIIFYDVCAPKSISEVLAYKEKVVIVFSENNNKTVSKFFSSNEVVFSYGYEQAFNDGYLTPAMDTRALGPAAEAFTKQLLEKFGYKQDDHFDMYNQEWDMLVYKESQKLWIECKVYKSQVVSPSAANSMLHTLIMRKMKQKMPQEDIILLAVFSKIPSFQKDEIWQRYRIVVWDIENLVFYTNNNPTLLKQLSQITYFPIDHIEGRLSDEAEKAGLSIITTDDEIIQDVRTEDNKTNDLIRRLTECKAGKKISSDYEDICEETLRFLFEANYFNRLTRQHKTKDEHFRMDLIGSLKISQINEDSMHPLWNLLVQHYNSHFVVFEFKNYSNVIDQNLIYITEKYLFDAALRNVAFIISRKGFSKAAKFAAEGCLKEHGKLILDVTEEDLIKMLELKSDKAADYLLDKLEEFLMEVSK